MRKRGAPAAERARIRRIALLGALALAACSGRDGIGVVTLEPDFRLEGSGTDIDSLAFWEAPDPADTLLFVTAKGNQRVEVWRFPFAGHEQAPLVHPSFGVDAKVNGIAVDQDADRLYLAISRPVSKVVVFSLPQLRFVGELDAALGDLGSEPNLALLRLPDGGRRVYVSADHRVAIVDAASGAAVGGFETRAGLETLAADDRDQLLYVPDENDRSGVYVYDPRGAPASRNGASRFGAGIFDADAEGIVVYRCESAGAGDDGRGLLVVADQRADHTEFELFDRRSWRHLGALVLAGVSNTDGIASTQVALPGHPRGLFAAVDDDSSVAGIGWDRILAATGIGCGEPAARRAPRPSTRDGVGSGRAQLRPDPGAAPGLAAGARSALFWGVYTSLRID